MEYAMKYLKKGDHANISCPYNLAYGEDGIPGVVPPKAMCNFQVEVIDFNSDEQKMS